MQKMAESKNFALSHLKFHTGVSAMALTYWHCFCDITFVFPLFSASAQQSQQIQEQVDKVQVKLQSAEDRSFCKHFRILGVVCMVSADFLSIIGSKHQEEKYADGAGDGGKLA